MRMLIYSSIQINDKSSLFGSDKNEPSISVSFSIDQSDNIILCETVPEVNDVEIYHELSKTYPIVDGLHRVTWEYSDFVANAGRTQLTLYPEGYAGSKTDIPHRFQKGEWIYVNSSNDSYFISRRYIIYEILDDWNIVLDSNFPGSGPVTPGYISYSNDEQNQEDTFTGAAIIKINDPETFNTDFNAWSYGNGLESDRILDDFNQTVVGYSPRSNSTINSYKQITSENAICYSGIFGINTSINKLNEISKILYGKNLLSDSIGTGTVVTTSEVLGTQISYPGEYGISRNPESFAQWGQDIYFTDSRRGSVLSLSSDSLSVISDSGMKSHFRDLMKNNPDKQKLGGYDPHYKVYVLSANNISSLPCKLSIDRTSLEISGTTTSPISLFNITTEGNWSISVIDTGDGTNWVATKIMSGTGSAKIKDSFIANYSNQSRSVKFQITYCDGLTIDFILTQGSSERKNVIPIVIFSDLEDSHFKNPINWGSRDSVGDIIPIDLAEIGQITKNNDINSDINLYKF